MIEQIRLENFKVARNLDLHLGMLTVLAGLNGAGKSTVLQAFALLRQSTEFGMHVPRLHLRGQLVTLGKARDVLYSAATSEQIVVALKDSGVDVIFVASAAEKNSDVLPLVLDKTTTNALQWRKNFQFIQADRMVPRTEYAQPSTPERERGWLGVHGEFTVDFLALKPDMKVSTRRTFPRAALGVDEHLFVKLSPTDSLLDQTVGWMQQFCPGVRVDATAEELVDSSSLRYRFEGGERDVTSQPYRPTNVGFGLTYSLPIIVACLAAVPGTLLLLENPEAHLHPQGQMAMGRLLAQCAADGVQIIVETHSDHLLNGIRLGVKNQSISAENVKLHYFTRPVNTGECFVQSPGILPDGQLTNWPQGFFDQWERSLDELLG